MLAVAASHHSRAVYSAPGSVGKDRRPLPLPNMPPGSTGNKQWSWVDRPLKNGRMDP